MSFVELGAGKAVLFEGYVKLRLPLYRETSRHSESKERPGRVCLLCHAINHLQFVIKNFIIHIFKIRSNLCLE